MEYLFFDIECANCFGGNGKICSFGYVLTNEDLQVLDQRDIVINPRHKFHLGARGKVEIELAYPMEQFKNAPDFPHYYRLIRDLLTAPDRVAFGHSVNNDMRFLMSECARYKLDYFDFTAYDTQLLHRYFTKSQFDKGLSKICETYGIDCSLALHRSDYDAFLTMQVFARLCKEEKVAPDALLALCPSAHYTAEHGAVINHFTTPAYTKKLTEFSRHCRPLPQYKKSGLWDKNFCFSKAFESEKFKEALYLVKSIRDHGGQYCSKIGNSDYYLQWGDPCVRTKRIDEIRATGKELTVLDEEGMLELLAIPREEYNDCPLMSITQLRGKRRHKPRRRRSSAQQATQTEQARDPR